jgi:hypothetical protein
MHWNRLDPAAHCSSPRRRRSHPRAVRLRIPHRCNGGPHNPNGLRSWGRFVANMRRCIECRAPDPRPPRRQRLSGPHRGTRRWHFARRCSRARRCYTECTPLVCWHPCLRLRTHPRTSFLRRQSRPRRNHRDRLPRPSRVQLNDPRRQRARRPLSFRTR